MAGRPISVLLDILLKTLESKRDELNRKALLENTGQMQREEAWMASSICISHSMNELDLKTILREMMTMSFDGSIISFGREVRQARVS